MTNKPVDLEQVKSKLIDKLRESEWSNVLKGFIFSDDFDRIFKKLYELRKENKRFTPPLKDIFSVFEKCPYSNLKVVVINHEPYLTLGTADGMAFSCSKSEKVEPALKYILKAINKTIYKDSDKSNDIDLTRWANQGVLLLNTSLTSEINKSKTHIQIWKPFITYLLDILNSVNSDLVFIFFGKSVLEFEDLIDETRHHKLYVTHPINAHMLEQEEWNSDDVFVKTNIFLKERMKQIIDW
jgi:uracil-DNA glycosylase